jgi:ammonium transporter, Amt family
MTSIPGGWLNHNWIQLAYQLAASTSGFAYSFFGTYLILFLMNLIPGLSLRASAAEEEMGLDEAQLGEFAYDYVELKRDLEADNFGEAKVVNFAAEDHGEGVYSSGGSGEASMEMRLMPVSLRDEDEFQGERDQDV